MPRRDPPPVAVSVTTVSYRATREWYKRGRGGKPVLLVQTKIFRSLRRAYEWQALGDVYRREALTGRALTERDWVAANRLARLRMRADGVTP